jgi:glucokinase
VVGIDVGGSTAIAVRLDPGAGVTARTESPAGGDLTETIVEVAGRVWSSDVVAVGAGVAGLVRYPDGFVWGPHVAGSASGLGAALASHWGVPVVVDNDVNSAAFAEFRVGAAAGRSHGCMVTVGTGIGGAIVIDGRIWRGRGFAGEPGHITVEPDGAPCSCGRRGCWETTVSGPALAGAAEAVRRDDPDGPFAAALGPGPVRAEAVSAAAAAGELTAIELVAAAGAALGRGLATLVAVLDPEVIVIGGGLGSIGPHLLEPARAALAAARFAPAHWSAPDVVTAGLGPGAGAVGAALLALEAT